ncbi:hydroxypyruvate isomerase family protein [Skermania sp. ID1734]|uniref:hydroxypyruvate isomerase family protein n=1 Tax=Skermania sp. ID1734 TaxID=2597516 RepID=UPI001C8F5A1E|nr:TIM barrel protein [Skermania sp. ID1734]
MDWVVNCSILFTDLDLLDRPAAAARAGFDAVEFWWPFSSATPSDRDVDRFAGAVEQAGVRLWAMNFYGGDLITGERGLASDPTRTAEFRDNADAAIAIGRRLGIRMFNVLYGNRLPGLDPREQDELAAENLAYAGRAASQIGAVILIEPLSAVPTYPLRSAAEGVAVLDRVRAEHQVTDLRLLADLYHLAVNGDDVPTAIAKYADRIGHVQIADHPGRGMPGTGNVDLVGQLDLLVAHGYRGRVALEYSSTAADPFAWMPPRR